jgi:hypothetical protein
MNTHLDEDPRQDAVVHAGTSDLAGKLARPVPRTENGLLDEALRTINARMTPDAGSGPVLPAPPSPPALVRALGQARRDRTLDFLEDYERRRPASAFPHLVHSTATEAVSRQGGPVQEPAPEMTSTPRSAAAAHRPTASEDGNAAAQLHETTRLFLATLDRREAALETTNTRLLDLLERLIDTRQGSAS